MLQNRLIIMQYCGSILYTLTHAASECYIHVVCAADGIEEHGSSIMYKANVRRILTEGEGDQLKAVGVQLLDGRTFKGQVKLRYLL